MVEENSSVSHFLFGDFPSTDRIKPKSVTEFHFEDKNFSSQTFLSLRSSLAAVDEKIFSLQKVRRQLKRKLGEIEISFSSEISRNFLFSPVRPQFSQFSDLAIKEILNFFACKTRNRQWNIERIEKIWEEMNEKTLASEREINFITESTAFDALTARLREWTRENSALFSAILLMQPIEIEQIHSEIQSAKIPISFSGTRKWIESEGIDIEAKKEKRKKSRGN